MGARDGAGCRMGDGYGISGSACVRDAGFIVVVPSMAAGRGGSMASDRWRGSRGRTLRNRAAQLSACGLRFVATELFLLRSQFFFVYAAAGIPWSHLSSSGSTAETSVRLCARIILRITGVAGGSTRVKGLVEGKDSSRGGRSGRGNRFLLLSLQCVVLLVEGRTNI